MAARKIRNILAIFGLPILTLCLGCDSKPNERDIEGTWSNPDGPEITFERNGTFSASAIPQDLFFRNHQASNIDGKGFWKIEKGTASWRVELHFNQLAGEAASFLTSVLISGSGASIYLYLWTEEEGEERFKFERTTPINK